MELGIYSFGDVQIDATIRKRGSTARAQRNARDDRPGMFFMHLGANDHAGKPADGLTAGLERVSIK
jgi:hypothetical protein